MLFICQIQTRIKYTVFARDDLSGGTEGRALKAANSQNLLYAEMDVQGALSWIEERKIWIS